MKTSHILILLAIVAAGVAAYLFTPTAPTAAGSAESTTAPDAEAAQPSAATTAGKEPTTADAAAPTVPGSGSDLRTLIDRVLATLQRGPNESAVEQLRQALLASEPRFAINAIVDFLADGRDASTGAVFTVGEKGALTDAPTLRTMLLDVLGQIARRTRSDAAARVSRGILESKDSADEWALALRNIAWQEPAAKPFLASKMREMLAHEPWRKRPSAGMLEAFDIAVYTQDASLVPDLADAQRSGSRDLQYAAAVALDRLAEQGPLAVMTYLNTHPTELADRPLLRADYYAKADLSQVAQRAAVEIYLGRPDVTLDEKSKLLKGLATPGTFVAETLVTEPPPTDDGAVRLDALSKATREWLANDRFPDLKAPLAQLQRRLGP